MKGRFIKSLLNGGKGVRLAADDGAGGNGGSPGEGKETDKGQEGSETDGDDPGKGDDGDKDNGKGGEKDVDIDKLVSFKFEQMKKDWENEKSEAEKLKKMTEEQKKAYEDDKRVKALEERERKINERELKAQAYETLAEKGLPKELIDTLNFKDADSCNASLNAVEKVFKSAVETQVNEKLKSGSIPRGKGNADKSFNMDDLKTMSVEEINANWDKIQNIK